MKLFGHFHLTDDRKKYCPKCSKPMKNISNEADTVFYCKKCGTMTYNSFKYEAEFREKSDKY